MPNISKLILIRDILQITPLLAVVACSSNTATQADASVPSSDASGSQTDAALADATSNEDGSTSPQDAGVDAPLTASEKTWCDAQQSHGTCPNAIAPSSCSDATKCRARQFSQVGLSAYVSCYSAPSCKTTDECGHQAGLAAGGKTASDYTAACLQKRTDCSNAFNDDWCSAILFAMSDASLGTNLAACLTKACGDMTSCFQAVEAVYKAACK